MDKLNLRDLVSISMDGPNVNWKLFDLFQKDQAEQYGGEDYNASVWVSVYVIH